MHIGMIAYTNYEYDPRVRREAESLAARGDRVDFLCLREINGLRTRTLTGVRLLYLNAGKYRGENTFRYLLSYFRFFVHATYRIAVEHARHRYDIVHVHTMPDFIVFSALIPKIFGAKVVLDVHDLTPELYASKFAAGRRVRVIQFLTFVERCSIAFAHKAIAVHRPHLEALVSHGNPRDKFFVLLNTPDEKIFDRASPAVQRQAGLVRVIYHGAISRRHGLEVAIRAVAAVRRRIPSLSFEIIGAGDDVSRLKRLADELSLGDAVKFVGPVPLQELSAVIRSADLGLIPIQNDVFTKYMLPTKLLEYVFLGIPCIASRTTTIESYFDDSMVRYVKAGDAEELANALSDLFHHPDKRSALVENANRFNEEFSWEKQKILFYRFVDDVAGKTTRSAVANRYQEEE